MIACGYVDDHGTVRRSYNRAYASTLHASTLQLVRSLKQLPCSTCAEPHGGEYSARHSCPFTSRMASCLAAVGCCDTGYDTS